MPMEYFEQRERALLGDRFDVLYAAPQETAERGVTVSALRSSPEQFAAKADFPLEASPFCKAAFVVHRPDDLKFRPGRHPYHHAGVFYSQEPSASSAAPLLGVQPGMRVLDCCAAPGGKSFACAIAMGDRGEVVSCDLHPHKKALIQAGADRLGLTCIHPKTADASAFRPEWEGAFDTVLVDAPCSGLGVIRKKPDIRYKDPEPLKGLPPVQLAILNNAKRYVKPGGVLLYSTCTVLERENQEVIRAFLAENSQFAPEGFTLPGSVGSVEEGMVTLWPHLYGTDGFFICKLRKGESPCNG